MFLNKVHSIKSTGFVIFLENVEIFLGTYNCFNRGKPSKAPWKMCTIKFNDNLSFSNDLISPNVLLSTIRSEFSAKSKRRRFVKLAKSTASTVDIWFLLKSL